MTKEEQIELIADVLEAMELMNEFVPVYLEVLRRTKDPKQALDAVKFLKGVSDAS